MNGVQHIEHQLAPLFLLRRLWRARFIKRVRQHRHMVAVDNNLTVFRHAFHLAPRRAVRFKRSNPRQIFIPRAGQRGFEAVDDPEVVANRQAVIDDLLRLGRRSIVLINKFTAQLTEHHLFAHRIRASSTTWLSCVTISVRRGSFSVASHCWTWASPWFRCSI